ncbi:MAG: tRNA (adenosine(37)-N6)-dimethylallyltransferase MiaA, partial [Clostridia bacterium]|nr:tRNA (adenosine(37)-N6)-dimethylallyltransferase MiaA [Clostridia bacterium]
MPRKVLVICGATASGKTRLAVDCALKFNTEIISADSQLIYKGLNIGTAKPTAEEMRGVKHHLIDVVDPTETFSVSDYAEKALPVLENLLSKGKIPIICGGTGFYINSLLFDLGYGNAAANERVREKYAEVLEKYGKGALFEKLREVAPETAAVLQIQHTQRQQTHRPLGNHL